MPYPSVTRCLRLVVARAIQRMRHGSDELPGRVARKLRVRVEGDHVSHVRQDRGLADDEREAIGGAAAQQRVQLRELPSLALIPHPEPLPRIPASAGDGRGRRARPSRSRTSHSAPRSSPARAGRAARPPEAFPRARRESPSAGRSAGARPDSPGTGPPAPRPDPRCSERS